MTDQRGMKGSKYLGLAILKYLLILIEFSNNMYGDGSFFLSRIQIVLFFRTGQRLHHTLRLS